MGSSARMSSTGLTPRADANWGSRPFSPVKSRPSSRISSASPSRLPSRPSSAATSFRAGSVMSRFSMRSNATSSTVLSSISNTGHYLNGIAVANSLGPQLLKVDSARPSPQSYTPQKVTKHAYAASFGKASRFPPQKSMLSHRSCPRHSLFLSSTSLSPFCFLLLPNSSSFLHIPSIILSDEEEPKH
ncbi:putative mitochondrial protein [Andalucia godoyi]|uniref:Putative mitochondrial protein n=1 Tax=Andalucia godoyi TaxID=505711 RepID=A0A8K0AHG1_ANDGO|nr:putative mitochondrial protein [Andalucia godoyi]|eukprot:ANDGO_08767.mRNA.1 putative mitochondrial protein